MAPKKIRNRFTLLRSAILFFYRQQQQQQQIPESSVGVLLPLSFWNWRAIEFSHETWQRRFGHRSKKNGSSLK